ncbi:DUF2076 domain-containing protein [Buchnera aphidicola]|uniref:DUF2076 domain-containing protein n=1 Tax=Buchnera aphidicola TaxID=9 RepID=UPI00346393B3
MDKKEKKLVEELFFRLKKAEEKSSVRDKDAEKFINDCYEKQKNSVYYMIQTILVQEVAIKKLNQIIDELQKKIHKNSHSTSKKTFLSGLLDKYLSSEKNGEKFFKNNNQGNASYHMHRNHPDTSVPINNNSISSENSFLGNALQTAAGVAGGMVAGNMLMNLFSHHRPDEEILHIAHENYFPSEESQEINNNIYVDNIESSEPFENHLNNFQENQVENDDSFLNDHSLNNEKNFFENDDHQERNNENFLDDDLEDDNF